MHRSRRTMLVALRLVALQLAALQLFAAPRLTREAHAPHELRAPHSAARDLSVFSSDASGRAAQRRGRRRRAADALTRGVWGGRGMRFEVTDGGATIEYDCGRATIAGRIVVDRAGRFAVAATQYDDARGPVTQAEGESPRGYPVRVTGRVGGSLMKLTVTRGKKSIGTFNLARDAEPMLVKCQ